jgi:flagellar biosynthesis protein FlhF
VAPPSLERAAASPRPADGDAFSAEVAELRSLLIRFGGARALPSPLVAFYTGLLNAGVEEAIAFRILDGLATVDAGGRELAAEALDRSVEDRIAGLVRVAGSPTAPRDAVIAFVGPAGAGKTTTSAKLAVRAHVAEGAARIVSLDGVNLGACGYLDALASASGVPYALALTPDEIRAALGERPAGLTVIDTPGVTPRDEAAVTALAGLLRVAAPVEVHLVLPATAKPDDALAAVRGLAPLGLTHVAFTRLDETATCGSLLTVCATSGLPLSYVASGRDIPDDLDPATARGLARRVLRGEIYARA